MLCHKGTQRLETDRLVLREFTLDDAEDMFKNWGNDPEVTRFLSWKPHGSIEVTKEYIEKCVSEYGANSRYNWVIELKENGEAIGGISIVHMEEKYLCCEIGYNLSSEYWNRGIMSESLKAVIDFLFSEVGFNRIAAKYNTVNAASGKVMHKAGMHYEGTLRQVKRHGNGPFYDLGVYSILKDEWMKNNID